MRSYIPKLRRDKGRGFVELDGKRIYLGTFGANETRDKYEQLIGDWLSNGRTLPASTSATISSRDSGYTIGDLISQYLKYCESYYQSPDGVVTSQLNVIENSLAPLSDYKHLPCDTFSPIALRTIRDKCIASSLARTTINKYVGTICKAFKWGCGHSMVLPETYQGLLCVESLRKGRSEARETEKVIPAPVDSIFLLEPYVSKPVWALLQLQLYCGARSGELCGLRGCDINTSGEVWSVSLEQHKTSYRGKARTLYFGSKAQGIWS